MTQRGVRGTRTVHGRSSAVWDANRDGVRERAVRSGAGANGWRAHFEACSREVRQARGFAAGSRGGEAHRLPA